MPSSLPLDDFYMGRILNFGHRGASHDAPANTLAAFELAAQYGADGVELDVMFTADREVVVIHDYSVDETTDGKGLVSDLTLSQIKALDAGSYKDTQYAGERVPTLEEVFEAFGDRLLFNVELKGISFQQDGLEAEVAALISKFGLEQRVIISSFNPLRLRRMRAVAPQLPIGLLHTSGLPWTQRWVNLFGWVAPHEADHPRESEITASYMARMRRNDIRVNPWVVNDPDRMEILRDMGVDLMITDRPDILRAVLTGER